MTTNETRPPAKAEPQRVVVVDRSKYDELLVSRRNLERFGERDERLLDRETREIFVVEEGAEVGMARNA